MNTLNITIKPSWEVFIPVAEEKLSILKSLLVAEEYDFLLKLTVLEIAQDSYLMDTDEESMPLYTKGMI